MVALKSTFYIFGGEVVELTSTNTIAAFSTLTKEWKQIGFLNHARDNHGVFIHQGRDWQRIKESIGS